MLFLVIFLVSVVQLVLFWLNCRKGKAILDYVIISISLFVYYMYIPELFFPDISEDRWICGNVFAGIALAVFFYGTIATIITYFVWRGYFLKRLK